MTKTLSVNEYAKKRGITPQGVYFLVKNHKVKFVTEKKDVIRILEDQSQEESVNS